MTRSAIKEFTVEMRQQYLSARTKGERSRIIDYFCQVTKYHRKSAIRLLRGAFTSKPKRPVGRPRVYVGQGLLAGLELAWEASGRICSKRLAPFMGDLVESLEQHGELHLEADIRSLLVSMSAATIDRLLKPARQRALRRPFCQTRASNSVQRQVPIRTFGELRGLPLGYLECDLVSHCGTSTEGHYLTSLVGVDVSTGWTACVAVWGKGQSRVGGALDRIRRELPFAIREVHTDNGGEFVNQSMAEYCERHGIACTRGRPYKKNDQPRVEQKNGSLVRAQIGYDRYESHAAQEQLQRVHDLLCVHVNLFQPICKLTGCTREGSKVKKTYDVARTPYQRLQASGALDEPTAAALAQRYQQCNPLKLRRQIEAEIHALWQLAVPDRASVLAQRVQSERDAGPAATLANQV